MSEVITYLETLVRNPLVTFLAGVTIGAAGKYLAEKHSDRRRAKELNVGLRQMFQDAASMMPQLMKEMQEDLSKPKLKATREFIVLPNKRVSFYGDGKMFNSYFEDEHEDLMNKIKLLETCGFIHNTTETITPKYRMTEEFVNCVQRAKFKGNKVKI